ncbi:DsrE family protein [Sphingomonas sp. LaA6.9]|nr:DsrE family protein [Sphingomonas sp. LaA6.9]MCJ8157441.1 DsrE family protein [Sphingomonas sp. LaA6.9]
MPGLTIIVTSADPTRFHAALSIAAASAATSAPTRVYLHADAVALAAPPHDCPDDARYAAGGLPTLAQLIEEVRALSVRLIVCQTGLALASLDAGALGPNIEAGGLVSLLSSLGDDRLVTL